MINLTQRNAHQAADRVMEAARGDRALAEKAIIAAMTGKKTWHVGRAVEFVNVMRRWPLVIAGLTRSVGNA